MSLSAWAKEIHFVILLLEEMNEVQKPSVTYDDNQGEIFLTNNRQVGMHTKHIDIRQNFMKYMV